MERGTGPARGAFLGWAPRGDLVGDPRALSSAAQAWDAAHGEHQHIRALYLGHDSQLGTIAILEGRSRANGAVRTALLIGLSADDLRVDVDGRAPFPSSARAVSFLFRQLVPPSQATAASGDALTAQPVASSQLASVLVTLPEPDAAVSKVTSWAWDTYEDGHDTGQPGLDVRGLPAPATSQNTDVMIVRGGDRVSTQQPLAKSAAHSRRIADATAQFVPRACTAARLQARTTPQAGASAAAAPRSSSRRFTAPR